MSNRRKRELYEEQLSSVQKLYRGAYSAWEERHRDRHLENMLYVRGYQSAVVNPSWETDQDEPYMSVDGPKVANFTRGLVRADAAATLRYKPNVAFAAPHSDTKAKNRAEATTRLAQSFLRNGVVDWEAWYRAVWQASTTGIAYIKTTWDDDGGRCIMPPPEATPGEIIDGLEEGDAESDEYVGELDPFGNPVDDTVYEGEISQQYYPAGEVLRDPHARNWREVRHVFHKRHLPKQSVMEAFPVDMFGDEWSPAERADFGQGDEIRQYGQDDDGAGELSESDEERVEIIEFWEKPSTRYKNGRYIIYCGETLLYANRCPLYPARIPFTPVYGSNLNPNNLEPDGLVADVRTFQASANQALHRTLELLDTMVTGDWLVPHGSQFDIERLDEGQGRILQYTKGMAPEKAPIPDLPQSLSTFYEQMSDNAAKVAGVHDIMQGFLEQGQDLSGISMRILREQNDGVRAPQMMLYRQSFLDALQQALYCARQFYEDGREVRVFGENDAWHWQVFDIDDFDFDTELVPEIHSGVPQTPGERLAETIELMGAGFFADTPDAERARLNAGDDYHLKSTSELNTALKNRYRRILHSIRTEVNYEPDVQTWDRFEVAAEIIDVFRCTPEYENLSIFQKEALDGWYEKLALFHEAAQIDQQATQAPQPGAPGVASPPAEKGMPSPPGSGSSPAPVMPGGSPEGMPAPGGESGV